MALYMSHFAFDMNKSGLPSNYMFIAAQNIVIIEIIAQFIVASFPILFTIKLYVFNDIYRFTFPKWPDNY